jgi:hypothetical protein
MALSGYENIFWPSMVRVAEKTDLDGDKLKPDTGLMTQFD